MAQATDVLDLLILARAFVEAGWAKGGLASDGQQYWLPWHSPATHFCLIGAVLRSIDELMREWPNRKREEMETGLRRLLSDCLPEGYDCPATWQDLPHVNQADVLALFDAACERVGKS